MSSRPGPMSLPIGWRPKCSRCRVNRHDRCTGPMDCGCDDAAHYPDQMTQDEYDQLVRDWEAGQSGPMTVLPDSMVMVPMVEVARRLTFDEWVLVGRERGWTDGDTVIPPAGVVIPPADAVMPPAPTDPPLTADSEGTPPPPTS